VFSSLCGERVCGSPVCVHARVRLCVWMRWLSAHPPIDPGVFTHISDSTTLQCYHNSIRTHTLRHKTAKICRVLIPRQNSTSGVIHFATKLVFSPWKPHRNNDTCSTTQWCRRTGCLSITDTIITNFCNIVCRVYIHRQYQ